ncbi:hypothetical protein N8612_04655 [Verrucomicrobia bacterium]|jgi:hypothetical protein|nr:hypothetical protein [Verrucomicrobiota bacterium]
MGYSIRTETHRYTRWIRWLNRKPLTEELYDYTNVDNVRSQLGNLIEHVNVVDFPPYADRLEKLREMMDETLAERTRAIASSEAIENRLKRDR